MKKWITVTLNLTLALALFTGCAGKPAASQPAGGAPNDQSAASPVTNGATAVKTGLSIVTGINASKDASADAEGKAQVDISLVAVTVGDDGVIYDCEIDGVQAKIGFDAAGKLTTDPTTIFASKNELGEAYGLEKVSSIGEEWDEQADAMAEYAVGKTVDELKGIAVNENGAPTGVDLASSVTISITDFVAGIEEAVKNAEHLGAKRGDSLELTTVTEMSESVDASAEGDGLAQTHTSVAAVTFDDDTITSCHIDAVQVDVNFNAQGIITTDLTAEQPTKNQLGDAYGMKKASAIGKEWYEQTAAFSQYVTGKTAEEVASIAVDEKTSPTEADLTASVTVGIGDFQTLIKKAEQ